MCSYAPGGMPVDLFNIYRVISLDLVKSNFQLVLRVAEKVFNLESWKFIWMLFNVCSCAPGVLLVDFQYLWRYRPLLSWKTCRLQFVICYSKSIWLTVMKLLQECWLGCVVVHLGFCLFKHTLGCKFEIWNFCSSIFGKIKMSAENIRCHFYAQTTKT
jgi:uncharacterized membrane protein